MKGVRTRIIAHDVVKSPNLPKHPRVHVARMDRRPLGQTLCGLQLTHWTRVEMPVTCGNCLVKGGLS